MQVNPFNSFFSSVTSFIERKKQAKLKKQENKKDYTSNFSEKINSIYNKINEIATSLQDKAIVSKTMPIKTTLSQSNSVENLTANEKEAIPHLENLNSQLELLNGLIDELKALVPRKKATVAPDLQNPSFQIVKKGKTIDNFLKNVNETINDLKRISDDLQYMSEQSKLSLDRRDSSEQFNFKIKQLDRPGCLAPTPETVHSSLVNVQDKLNNLTINIKKIDEYFADKISKLKK